MEPPASLREAIALELEGVPGRLLGAAGRRLSRHYREGRTSRSVDPSAYLTARLPGTYAATSDALAESAKRCAPLAPTSLLDVGSGPGTAAWAALEVFPTLRSVTLLDESPAMQAVARRLAEHAPWGALRHATFALSDLSGSRDLPAADLVTSAFVLGEVADSHLPHVVDHLIRAACRVLIVVEPGTPAGYRRVLDVRRRAVAKGWHVAAPCSHEAACPLVGEDWCHFPARFQRTAGERRSRGGTRPFADEKYSYVALCADPVASGGVRVIDRPRRGKGHLNVRLCTSDGLREVEATKREGETYRRLRRADWGTWLPPD